MTQRSLINRTIAGNDPRLEREAQAALGPKNQQYCPLSGSCVVSDEISARRCTAGNSAYGECYAKARKAEADI